jgi:hypothetical protein
MNGRKVKREMVMYEGGVGGMDGQDISNAKKKMKSS